MGVKEYYTFTPSASQAFGAPRSGGKRKHRGVDRSTSTRPGTPVPALLGGVVISKETPSSAPGFGYQTRVRSKYNGRVYYLSYSHGSKASALKIGQTFAAGAQVITEGTTGATFGSCVHIEVYDVALGKFIDPMTLIRAVVKTHQVSGGTTVVKATPAPKEDDMPIIIVQRSDSNLAKGMMTHNRKMREITKWENIAYRKAQAQSPDQVIYVNVSNAEYANLLAGKD